MLAFWMTSFITFFTTNGLKNTQTKRKEKHDFHLPQLPFWQNMSSHAPHTELGFNLVSFHVTQVSKRKHLQNDPVLFVVILKTTTLAVNVNNHPTWTLYFIEQQQQQQTTTTNSLYRRTGQNNLISNFMCQGIALWISEPENPSDLAPPTGVFFYFFIVIPLLNRISVSYLKIKYLYKIKIKCNK